MAGVYLCIKLYYLYPRRELARDERQRNKPSEPKPVVCRVRRSAEYQMRVVSLAWLWRGSRVAFSLSRDSVGARTSWTVICVRAGPLDSFLPSKILFPEKKNFNRAKFQFEWSLVVAAPACIMIWFKSEKFCVRPVFEPRQCVVVCFHVVAPRFCYPYEIAGIIFWIPVARPLAKGEIDQACWFGRPFLWFTRRSSHWPWGCSRVQTSRVGSLLLL